MSVADVLHDAAAEHACAGVAVLSHFGALEMADVLDDLYDPRVARIIETACELPASDSRDDAIADLARVERQLVAEWVAATPVMWDTSGALRGRVRAAAGRRREIYRAVNELEAMTGMPIRFGAVA